MSESALERWQRAEVKVDCWHPALHQAEHHPHPATGRLVCHVCHPPMPDVKA